MNSLCRQFYSHTPFSKYLYQKQKKIVRLSLQRVTAIKHLFCGDRLEWFASGKMPEEAKQEGRDYAFSHARSIKIEFDNEDKHELDAVSLPAGREPIVVERKSGEFE